MKLLKITSIALMFSTAAYAEDIDATVQDVYTNITESIPYTTQQCQMVEVPVYGTVQRQGDAAGSALLGMIIGGAIGKGLSGNNDGAAAGAVMGGIVGADQGSRTRTERVITGYRQERQCQDITQYREQSRRVYDYSIISFRMNGKLYELGFDKNE